ncbi:MAG: hypothetical protein IPN71_02765 [Fibrobacteres bacterium]|nr:hypothetical protein [Fibrobacterota bacterium]
MRLLPLFALLLSCSEKPVQTPPPPSGWRPASVEAESQGEGDNFWWRLTSAGNRLLAMTGMGDIWVSESYSAGFRKMEWKWPGRPYTIAAEGDSAWVGTEEPGRVYKCRITNWACVDLKLPDPDSMHVGYVGKFKDNIVVSSDAYKVRSIWWLNQGTWKDWSQGFPIDGTIYRTLEIGDTLWAATWSNGLWYRVASEASWKRQPSPRRTWVLGPDSATAPRGIAWHSGALWVAYQSKDIIRMPNAKPPYQTSSNCLSKDGLYGDCKNPPVNIYSILSYRDRLFVGGYYGAAPYVLDERTGFWITTEIAGWCWNDNAQCGGTRTWDLVGLGDTLYSASSRYIMKIPLAEVPGFQPSMMAQFHWSSDTSWRDSVLRRNNPIGW